MRIAIIFRETGKRISQDKKRAYHKYVDVYWQANAWADINFSSQRVDKTLNPTAQNDKNSEFLLFCDSLSAQTSELLLNKVRALNGIVCFGVPEAKNMSACGLWFWQYFEVID